MTDYPWPMAMALCERHGITAYGPRGGDEILVAHVPIGDDVFDYVLCRDGLRRPNNNEAAILRVERARVDVSFRFGQQWPIAVFLAGGLPPSARPANIPQWAVWAARDASPERAP